MKPQPNKTTVIFDLDGTISIVGNRLKYILKEPKDWDAFNERIGEDEVNWPIAVILLNYWEINRKAYDSFNESYSRFKRLLPDSFDFKAHAEDSLPYRILFFTARTENTRRQTKGWFIRNLRIDVRDEQLFMRANGDDRHDTEVKVEYLEKAGIKTPSEDIIIYEDRSCMVKKWRELGFTVLQVADGDY